MDVDVVVSGPAHQPVWVGSRFLGETDLPVLSPGLMKERPVTGAGGSRAAHVAPRSDATPNVAAMADCSRRPGSEAGARDQVFEHFYFAIQAAIEGLGVAMGPLALVAGRGKAGGADQRTGDQDARVLCLCAGGE
jgi:LysR family glycine cleavage system transcriptional activator